MFYHLTGTQSLNDAIVLIRRAVVSYKKNTKAIEDLANPANHIAVTPAAHLYHKRVAP